MNWALKRRPYATCLIAVLVTGCASRSSMPPSASVAVPAPEAVLTHSADAKTTASPDAASPDFAPTAEVPVPPLAAVDIPVISSLDDYKRAVAQKIVQASREHLFDGVPPPMLKSVVVLAIKVNQQGRIAGLRVLRGNGHRSLERLAMQSVEAALPLPSPGRLASRAGTAEFNETWLFRDDGRFQLRSLAEAQADGTG